jgi:fatty acid/phospholipid biosynthesis enzyme
MIEDSSKVMIFMKGIKTTELDVCKANITAKPAMRNNFAAMVELYSTFVKQMKAEKPQMNILEVNYSKNKKMAILHHASKVPRVSQILNWMTSFMRNMSIML